MRCQQPCCLAAAAPSDPEVAVEAFELCPPPSGILFFDFGNVCVKLCEHGTCDNCKRCGIFRHEVLERNPWEQCEMHRQLSRIGQLSLAMPQHQSPGSTEIWLDLQPRGSICEFPVPCACFADDRTPRANTQKDARSRQYSVLPSLIKRQAVGE